ncbi:hypothetical protein FBU31_004412, partial [Coemansia sp. 'formosensis']
MIALLVSKPANGHKHASSSRSQTRTKHSSKPTPDVPKPGDIGYKPNPIINPIFDAQDITNSIEAQFDGVLIVKSEQTSCQVALVSDSYGFVAANCLLVKGKVVSSIADIQVAVHGPKLSALYAVANITIHPNYDDATLANNIAVIKYTSASKSGIKGKLAASTSKWDQLGYLRRTLADVPKVIWNDPSYLVTGQDEQDGCSLGSPLFSANRKNFICSNSTTKVAVGGSCSLPYGLIYGVVDLNKVAPAAIYSHTVVFGSGLCSNFMKLNYYVQLGNYVSWGAKVAGYTAKIVEDSTVNDRKLPSNSTFSMKVVDSSVPGVAVYGGNLFTLISDPKPTPTGVNPKPTKPSVITVTKTHTVIVTRPRPPTTPSDRSTILVVGPTSTAPTEPTKPTAPTKPTKATSKSHS